MRLGERAGATDPGRKRRRNEDALVLAPPLFAVADGMGGARGGAIASRLAATAFREYHDADDLPPEERVVAIIQEANRRIYERARSDAEASGMGTTVTAALIAADRVAIGHVGDSRAYRIRGSELEQLTQDHSLVADLIRSGRLSAEEAGTHPQRSVITRALGTDPEVDVDAFAVDAAPGDVFLLCSDGLTTMVDDDEIVRILQGNRGLDEAAKALVKAANRRGGDDNVTVVLFALDEGDAGDAGLEETAQLTTDGKGGDEDLEDTLSGLEAPVRVVPAAAPDEDARAAAEPARPRRRWGRRILLALVVLALAAVVIALVLWALRDARFVAAERDVPSSSALVPGAAHHRGGP